MLFLALFRNRERYAVHFHVQFKGHDNFLRCAFITFAHFHDTQLQQLLLALVHAYFVFEGESLVDASVGNVQVVDVRRILVRFYGEYVNVMKHRTHHFTLGAIAFNEHVLLLELLCFLKLHFFCQVFHFFHQRIAYLLGIAFQQLPCLRYLLHVFFVRLLPDAGSFAVLDVVFQADLELSLRNVFGRQCQVAGTERIQLFNQLQQGHHGRHVAVRTEVIRTVANNLPGLVDAREILVADADGRIGLVVLQQHVVSRLVFFYQVILQQQGILFRVHYDVADVGNLGNQHARLGRLVILGKIRIDTAFQILGFSHIDDDPFLVQVLVDARTFRKVQYDSFQVFAGVACLFCFFHVVGFLSG